MPPRDLPNARTSLWLSLGVVVLGVLVFVLGPELASPPQRVAETATNAHAAELVTHADIGFRSRVELDDHFQKHGREFGGIDKGEYLRRAQELRDRPAGGSVREIVREDGVITRFDTASGAFIAFNESLVIRTFFKPDDGVRYFERQARKEHE